MHIRARSLIAVALCTLSPPVADAQMAPEPPAAFLAPDFPRAQVLFLGVFHFDYPELDVEKASRRIDVLTEQRQQELEEIAELLAAFRPTRIAVELPPDRQPRLDSLYREYQAGRWTPRRNEVFQLGFRLARRLGQPGVHAVDAERHDFFVDLARNELQPRSAELLATDVGWRDRLSRLRQHEDSVSFERGESLREILLAANSAERLRQSHMAYSIGFFKYDGDPGGYLGTDFVSGWYNRNLRIFRNLQRLTASPEERILFIVGAGHVPILRFVAQHSPEFEVVEVSDYLGRAPG